MADKSFFVHLQSLFDFANELQTQLSGMTTPINHLNTLASMPVLLGDFGEASALGASHQAAVAEMAELLGQVQQAVDFAENITKTVATGYQHADQDVAGGMKVADTSTPTAGAGSPSLWSTAYGSPGATNGWGGSGSGGWGNSLDPGGNGSWDATNGAGNGGAGDWHSNGSGGGGSWT